MTVGQLKDSLKDVGDETPVLIYNQNNDLVEIHSAGVIGVSVSIDFRQVRYTETRYGEEALLIFSEDPRQKRF